jgi:DNA-directed RNA polymerase sigma subunit (sigma70/sigma32)
VIDPLELIAERQRAYLDQSRKLVEARRAMHEQVARSPLTVKEIVAITGYSRERVRQIRSVAP